MSGSVPTPDVVTFDLSGTKLKRPPRPTSVSAPPRFPSTVECAKRHYEAGLRIAELSLGADFRDLLPWGRINNRPYLRCLHGYGLCLWRQGNRDAARQVFERMLWLNPRDNQGARFLLAEIDAGKPWTDDG